MRVYLGKEIDFAVPVSSVLAMYGMTASGKMIPCPSIKHNDKHPSAKIYPDTNACYCFVCQRIMRPIDIVKQQENVNYPQACEILIERFGLDKDFYSEHYRTEEEKSILKDMNILEPYFLADKKTFPLNSDEVRLLGLYMVARVEECPSESLSLAAFMEEDTEGATEMVIGKINECMDKYETKSSAILELIEYFKPASNEDLECGKRLYEAYKEGVLPPRYSKNADKLFQYVQYRKAIEDFYEVQECISYLSGMRDRFLKTEEKCIIEINQNMEEENFMEEITA